MTDTFDDLLGDFTAAPTPEPAPNPSPERSGFSLDREGYAWASDVYWVYENIGEKMTKAKAGTTGRYALWQHAKKNMDQFIGQTLPKAMALLEKARDKNGDAEAVENEELKDLAEMQKLLRRAVAESQRAEN